MSAARESAFAILQKMERDNAYSTVALRAFFAKHELSAQDIQLTSALVLGVTERRITLDYILSQHLSQPLKKLKPQVLTILRIGAYQLLYMDKIPVSAAVNEAVKSAKKNGCAFASGLVNAVLRKVANAGLVYPETEDAVFNMSIRYSTPEWLVKHFIASYGDERAISILDSFEKTKPMCISVNTNRVSVDELRDRLVAAAVEVEDTEQLTTALMLKNTGNVAELPGFEEGYFHVQDLSSQLTCSYLDAKPGDFVVDTCAAPGGKSFTTAYKMNDSGRILSCDMHPFKTEIISESAKRLQLKCIETVCLDARKLKNTIRGADKVLCDVPCSGLGVIGRKPEIKYKNKAEMDALPILQAEILESCSEMVKPGGTLVYSTCTLNPSENEIVCRAFLEKHNDFYIAEPFNEEFLTIFPNETCDGFFIAKMYRKG